MQERLAARRLRQRSREELSDGDSIFFELLGSIVERDIACGGKFYEIFDGV